MILYLQQGIGQEGGVKTQQVFRVPLWREPYYYREPSAADSSLLIRLGKGINICRMIQLRK